MDTRSNRFLRAAMVLFAIAGGLCALLLSAGCVSVSDLRQEGFDRFNQAFALLDDAPPGLHRVIVLERVEVHLVGSRSQFGIERYRSSAYGVVGYATSQNQIWLFVKYGPDGLLRVNQAVVGHEATHLLNYADPAVANPDKLQDPPFFSPSR